MFIVIELLRRIIAYFTVHRLKITFITAAALVFVLREIMIGLFQHDLAAGMILGLAALILAICAIRTLAVIYSPEKYLEMEETHHGQWHAC